MKAPPTSNFGHFVQLLIACVASAVLSLTAVRGFESIDRWIDKAAQRPNSPPRVFFETIPGPETYVPAQQQPTLVPEPIDTPLPEPERPPRSRLLPPLPESRPDRET